MTDKQYYQLLQNRRGRQASLAFSGPAQGRLLRTAARSLRRRAAAEEALGSMLPGHLLEVTRVQALEQGTLTLSVSDRASWEQMRRRMPRLRKDLAAMVPGVRQVRITPALQVDA